MRNWFAAPMAALLTVLVFSSGATAQTGRGGRRVPDGYIAEGVPKMPDPPGPAPKRDLSGAWVGPQDRVMGPFPTLTPAGEARFKMNKPYVSFQTLKTD